MFAAEDGGLGQVDLLKTRAVQGRGVQDRAGYLNEQHHRLLEANALKQSELASRTNRCCGTLILSVTLMH